MCTCECVICAGYSAARPLLRHRLPGVAAGGACVHAACARRARARALEPKGLRRGAWPARAHRRIKAQAHPRDTRFKESLRNEPRRRRTRLQFLEESGKER
eukprot:5397435-Pleurochrysis_carterae.AAC.4